MMPQDGGGGQAWRDHQMHAQRAAPRSAAQQPKKSACRRRLAYFWLKSRLHAAISPPSGRASRWWCW
jgi:hypothetical protein